MKKKASAILPSGTHIFIILVILAALGITVAVLVPGAAMSALVVPESRLPELPDLPKQQIQEATTDLLKGLTPEDKADLASIYYDLDHDGQLVIDFTRNVNGHAAEVKSSFRYPDRVDVGFAPNSMASLDGLVSQLTQSLKSQSTIKWSEVYRDDVHNDVVVDTTSDPIDAKRQLEGYVGNQPFVVQQVSNQPQRANIPNAESPTQSSAPPVIGGLEISRPDSNVGWIVQCTSAFYATRGSAKYLLTAGHCDVYQNASSFVWSVGYPGSFALGTMAASRFQTGYQDDAGIINTTVGQKAEVWCDGWYNCQPTYAQSINDFWVSRVGQFLDGDDITNARVCDVGYHDANDSGNYCGTLISNNTTVNYAAADGYPDVTITNARIAITHVNFGFSGGAVYANGDINADGVHYTTPLKRWCCDTQFPVHALGIVSGIDGNGNLIYTHIQYAQSDLGVTVQTG